MSDAEQREEAVFEAAQQRQGAERAAYLEQACADDPALRARIEGLLDALDRAGGLLSEPAATRARGAELLSPSPTETCGDNIGRYKLLQQIGEGGCGTVYMAEQEEPVRRRVALKILKLGLDTRQVIARFEAERQALALMDHPNIAKVLDAGATETGRPYFVMELVRGVKITEFSDENQLPMKQRLELFIQVCQAIQHAHQKGIIHRDIKPSNILVTINDGVPVPKVIDFGIAKATTGQPLTDKTLFTAFEQFIGTPAYMSPEQAVMTSVDIDTRSDIYSLGVLLYELLTGKTPFDTKELLQAGLDEMRRTIREQEPLKPSTRLSTMLEGELTTTAKRRHTGAPKLIHLVSGDLDWIVMKCLEKDRSRRYETANGLSADITRHLNQEPVVACPPATFYRIQKAIQRHRLVFAGSSVVAVSLIIGLSVSIWFFFKERRARQRAVTAEKMQNDLRLEAQSGRMRAEARITALLYRQAFDTLPTLTDKERAVLADAKGVPLAETAALAARYDRVFELITRAAKTGAGCDWGSDPVEGPNLWQPRRSDVRSIVDAAQLRAREAFTNGRDADACNDLLATFILGRNIAVNGTLVGVMAQAQVETVLVEFVGENFFRFTAETLGTLAMGIENAPTRNNVSQAMSTEKIAFADWIVRREQAILAAAAGNEQKALAGILELLRSCLAEDAEEIVQAAGGTSAGVIAYTKGVEPHYKIVQSLATASPQDLAKETERAQKSIQNNTNLLVRTIIPNVGRARGRELETLTRLAMLQAAAAYLKRGMQGLNSVADPAGGGPFKFRRVESNGIDRGFELQSNLDQFGLKATQMFRDKPIAY